MDSRRVLPEEPVLPARFELVQELGAGATGVVYEARDSEFGKTVAVKVFHDRAPTVLDRIKREFRLAAAVRHPGLVRLGELFEHDGSLCFSMEYVAGVDLPTWVADGDRVERTRAAVSQLAAALAALHRAGVIHRDVKPANALVDRAGRVVLLDLGLAVTVTDATPELAGSVEYVAPEFARGGAPTPALDLYALGVTAFELLTGRPPFEGAPMEVLAHKAERDAPRASTRTADLPAALDQLIAALLARDPATRPAARAVVAALGDGAPPSLRRRRVTAHVEPALIGRGEELAALLAASDSLERGGTTLFVVRGAAGVGKTALLDAFADAAVARGHLVARGRCAPREHLRLNAWDALVDELATYLAALPPDERAAALPDDASPLTRLFPSFARVAEVTSNSAASLDEVVADAVTAMRTILRRIARARRVVSILDDAHWATDASFELLLTMLRAPSPPCLVVFCVRTAAALPAAAQSRLAQLRELPVELHFLDVAPLPDVEAAALATRLTGDAELGRRIATAARGNPMFVELLAADPSATAPDVGALLRRRIGALPATHARVLRMITAARAPIDQALIGHGLDLGHDTLAAVLEELGERGLVRIAGVTRHDTCELLHDAVAGAVRDGADEPRLRDEHRRLALALVALAPDDPRAVEQWLAAGDVIAAATAALAQVTLARDAIGMTRAAALCAQVIAATPRPTPALLRGHADALAAAGRGEDAAIAYRVASLADTGDERLDLERLAALLFLRCGRVDDGLALARRAARGLDLELEQSHGALERKIILERARNRWRGLALATAQSDGHARRADVCQSLSTALGMVDVVRAAWFTSRGVRHALDSGSPVRAATALANEAIFLASRGARARPRFEAVLARAGELAARAGDPRARAQVELATGMARLLTCDYVPARAHCVRASAMFRTAVAGLATELLIGEFFTIVADFWLGAWGEAVERRRAALRMADATDDRYVRVALQTGVPIIADLITGTAPAELHAAMVDVASSAERAPGAYARQLVAATMIDRYAGADAAALARLDAAQPLLDRTRVLKTDQVRATLLALRATAAVAVGQHDRARADARALRTIPEMIGPAALIEAALAAIAGGDALTLIDEALRASEASGLRAYAAAARARRGQLLGGDEGASERLTALDLASRLGLGDAERAFDLLAPWPR